MSTIHEVVHARAKGKVKGPKGRAKIAKVFGEYKAGMLHSGSKKGPMVTSKDQAMAIAMSEGRKAMKGGHMMS